MARQSLLDDGDEGGGIGSLLRIVVWGLTASGALAVAVLAAQSQIGDRRVAAVTTPAAIAVQGEAVREAANQAVLRAFEAEREAKRLAETVRALEADRDKLAGRLAKLEGHIEDLTGSVATIQAAKRGPVGSDLGDLMAVPPSAAAGTFRPPHPTPTAATDPRTLPPIEPSEPATTATATTSVPPAVASASEEPAAPAGGTSVAGTVAGMAPSEIPLPRPNPNAQTLATQAVAAQTGAPRNEPTSAPVPAAAEAGKRFAIEIGGPNSIDSLRGLWAKVRDSQAGEFLTEVKPAIALRDGGKPGLVEMRLVAGPVASQLAAARLCASVAIAGVACRATSYDGQMLALP
ncbi:hypothetical protein [Rhodoplanes azumiensis]|uniref:SPOR domain-containing protein n=1 Tax=Rhodoplanes azumiensis TaxID=1897628 RepID=A0ABW5ACY6_9BRAD